MEKRRTHMEKRRTHMEKRRTHLVRRTEVFLTPTHRIQITLDAGEKHRWKGD
jgi:hypothetical protein